MGKGRGLPVAAGWQGGAAMGVWGYRGRRGVGVRRLAGWWGIAARTHHPSVHTGTVGMVIVQSPEEGCIEIEAPVWQVAVSRTHHNDARTQLQPPYATSSTCEMV